MEKKKSSGQEYQKDWVGRLLFYTTRIYESLKISFKSIMFNKESCRHRRHSQASLGLEIWGIPKGAQVQKQGKGGGGGAPSSLKIRICHGDEFSITNPNHLYQSLSLSDKPDKKMKKTHDRHTWPVLYPTLSSCTLRRWPPLNTSGKERFRLNYVLFISNCTLCKDDLVWPNFPVSARGW